MEREQLARGRPSKTVEHQTLRVSPHSKSTPERLEAKTLIIGELDNPDDRNQATTLIQSGLPIAAAMGRVYGLWVSGDSREAIKLAFKAKGAKPFHRPVSAMFPPEMFVEMVDKSKIPKPLLPLFTDPDILIARMGAITHIRAPITEEAARSIPKAMISRDRGIPYIHNLVPTGHNPMKEWIDDMMAAGIRHPGVFSLNNHGSAEITTLREAVKFCVDSHGIVPMLLTDPVPRRPEVRGSYAIIDVVELRAYRNGQFPVEVISEILGVPIDTNGMRPAVYPTASFPIELDGLTPEEIRARLLSYAGCADFDDGAPDSLDLAF